jgi:aminobenzoyl-glutamate transport protein
MFGNFLPYALDTILAGFSESAARIIDPAYRVNPLSNYWLAIATAVVVVPASWWLVDRVVEPRIAATLIDGDPALMPSAPALTRRERRALWCGLATFLPMAALLAWAVVPRTRRSVPPTGR